MGKTRTRNRDQELGFIWAIYFGHIFLFLKQVGEQKAGRLQWHFYVTIKSSQQGENVFQSYSSKQGDLTQTAPCVRATGDAAGAETCACGQKVPTHPHRMSHLIENNQSGRNNFLSFIRKFLLWYLAPFQFLACQAILLTIYLPLTLFREHLLNILNRANHHI